MANARGAPAERLKVEIVRARAEDAAALSAIAFAAKSHWRYPESWLCQWREALTVTPEYIGGNPTYIAITGETIVGFCSLQIESAEARLDHLWVVPPCMRMGVGRVLFEQAEKVAREGGAIRMKIVGDPHAENFYRRVGATIYGREPANMDGHERFLPLMEKML